MIYVFDTSALIFLGENSYRAPEVMSEIPHDATIYYHPITLAELTAQTHTEYHTRTEHRRKTPNQAKWTVDRRRALIRMLALKPGQRPELLRRNFVKFDTSTKAKTHKQKSVYDQLLHEKQQRHLYVDRNESRCVVLADMVDHMILSVATFLHHDKAGLVAFVTGDQQQFEAAQRMQIPATYVYGTAHGTGGRWL